MAVALKQMRQKLAHAEFVIDYEKVGHDSKKSFSIYHFPFSICHSDTRCRAVLKEAVKIRQSSVFSLMISTRSSRLMSSLRSIIRSQIDVSLSSLRTMRSLCTKSAGLS